jgi:hypothetical protein
MAAKRKRQEVSCARALRASLVVTSLAPLKKHILHDHFEHFDVRLDAWAEEAHKPGKGNVSVRNVAVSHEFTGSDLTSQHGLLLRYTHVVWFLGKLYPLRPMMHAIAKLHGATEIALENYLPAVTDVAT